MGGGSGWKGTVKEWVTTAGGGWEWEKGYSHLDVVRQVWVFDGFLHDRQQLGDGEYGTCFVVCQHVTQLRYTTENRTADETTLLGSTT